MQDVKRCTNIFDIPSVFAINSDVNRQKSFLSREHASVTFHVQLVHVGSEDYATLNSQLTLVYVIHAFHTLPYMQPYMVPCMESHETVPMK